MNPLDRFMTAINGSGKNPPVVVPYLQYYFPEIVEQITPFSKKELLEGDSDLKVDVLSELHDYFDCDWMRVTTDPLWFGGLYGGKMQRPSGSPIPAEQLLEDGLFKIAEELIGRFGGTKFTYGRVGVSFGALMGDFSDIGGAMIALKREPDKCVKVIEDSIPQRLEQIKAWAAVGVHGLWLGQWLCSADMISEADYVKFVYPYDKIIVDAVHAAGLVSIFHFCGDTVPRLKFIREVKPTIFGVEESKKGFDVDIGKVRAGLGPEFCILGNIDAYGDVERGTPEEWALAVERQIRAAGPERFIVSVGSPITPDTSPERLREFIRTGKRVRDNLPLVTGSPSQ